MDDLAHPQAAEAEVTADDLSTPEAVIEAESKTDAQNLYPDEAEGEAEAEPEAEDGEDEEDADGEPEEEDIAAPVGLKAEQKDQFAQLPKEAQRVVSEIIKSREVDAQKGVQSALEAQREAERTAADRVAQTQQQYAEQFAGLVQAFQPTPPPKELALTNVAEYQYRMATFQEEMATYQQLVEQITGIRSQAEQHFGAQHEEWTRKQVEQLFSVPEIADETTRDATLTAIKQFGNDLGYSQEELANATAKDIIALNKMRVRLEKAEAKAEKWDRHQTKRNERPRQATSGRFATAAVGNGTPPRTQSGDPLEVCYPNDFRRP